MCLPLCAQAPPERPKVFGVAHYSIFVSDLANARAFYDDFLGYVGLFDPDGTRVELMEVEPIDGKAAISSTLPPPR